MKNIALIGMPLSGKSTVAVALGKALKTEVADTDAEIEKKYGKISKIFFDFGEERFRDIEAEIIGEVCAREHMIISTGGGSVLREENLTALKRNATVIYLKAEPSLLAERAVGDGIRPLLNGNSEQIINALYFVRAPLYEAAADFTVEVKGLSPEEIAEKITEYIK